MSFGQTTTKAVREIKQVRVNIERPLLSQVDSEMEQAIFHAKDSLKCSPSIYHMNRWTFDYDIRSPIKSN
jgi:hypothetical protein